MQITQVRPLQSARPFRTVYRQRLDRREIAVALAPGRLCAYSVHFTPRARTAWHSHPLGQALHILQGVGRVQRRGGSIEAVRAGHAIQFEPDEWHWHGAAPNHFMTHLALQEADEHGIDASWAEHVADDTYDVEPVDS